MIASNKNTRGFATAKTLMGLASAGVVAASWWMLSDGEETDALPEALFAEVVRSMQPIMRPASRKPFLTVSLEAETSRQWL